MAGGVVLVNPPFGAIERPSIGLGLLQASARQAGIDCECVYANLAFARRIGLDEYFWLANTSDCRDLVGEWAFAGTVFPGADGDPDDFLREYLLPTYTAGTFRLLMPGRDLRRTLLDVRAAAAAFIDELAGAILAKKPRVVGCTSTFQQNCAALGLLKRIRERDDGVVTLLGGPNCEGPMAVGLRRRFPWVDFVVNGEAEESFPDVLRRLLAEGRAVDEDALPSGYVGRRRALPSAGPENGRLVVKDLGTTPVPDYDDYFDQLAASGFADRVQPGLLLETSRGCWWSVKRPCTFCGLNGVALRYRSKSPERVLQEIDALCPRHATPRVEFVDNNPDPRSVLEICTALSHRTPPVALFFETRVLDRRHLERMAEGGVCWLQVGIESFDPRLLAMMGKGTTPLQNVQVLRWAYEQGIRVTYNLIHGFPGEEDAWYLEMSRLLPLIEHLEPPRKVVPLRFDRFSDYCDHPERYGLRLAPHRAYGYVYPLGPEETAEFAYFFEDAGERPSPRNERGFEAFKQRCLGWRDAFWTAEPGRERAVLHLLGEDRQTLYDTRRCAFETVTLLSDLEAAVLRSCDQARSLPEIEALCSGVVGGDETSVQAAVAALRDRRVLVSHEGKFLSLAATPPRRPFPRMQDFPGGYYQPSRETDGLNRPD
jgi:ribosomal peptide maturation radical SAM protein 1